MFIGKGPQKVEASACLYTEPDKQGRKAGKILVI